MSYRLSDFGSYTVSGRVLEVTEGAPREVNLTRDARHTYDPRGHFAVEHAYVQYFVPEARNAAPPVVLVHGGGMHGSTWETTPDGRPGWLHMLLARGYEVHVLDNVERGRSGFAPGLWGEPILRSREEAWHLFRIGEPDDFAIREAYAGSLFPVEAFDAFARMLVPRWLTTTPHHVAALIATLRRTGPALVFCHSQGGEITLDAIHEAPELFAGLVAVEPSAEAQSVEDLNSIPTVVVAGDFLDINPFWVARHTAWKQLCADLAAGGGRAELLSSGDTLQTGHTHLPMHDHGHDLVLQSALEALSRHL